MVSKPAAVAIFVFSVTVFIGILYFLYPWNPTQFQTASPDNLVPTPTRSVPAFPAVSVNGRTYRYSLINTTGATVRLIPNFDRRDTAFELAKRYGCHQYINGSFYNTSNQPLGLFVSEGSVLGEKSRSPLLNGYLWQENGTKNISFNPPKNGTWIIQTGPILITGGIPVSLSIINDEAARRMVAMTDTNGNLFFASVFEEKSVLSGPYLSNLPDIVSAIAADNDIAVSDAVNLDGGSASSFYEGEHSLSEITPVGSLFCITK